MQLVLDKHSDQTKVIFKCYYGVTYVNRLNLIQETRKRKTSSRLLGCQFQVTARFSKISGLWTIRSVEEHHNHDVSENQGGVSIARRLTSEEKQVVREMADAGIGASTTLSYLKTKTGNQWTTRKEIYNEKVVARKDFLAGRSSI